jgi:hypothetical protein
MWPFTKNVKMGFKIENHPQDRKCILISIKGTGLNMNNPVHLECVEVIIKDNIQEMFCVGHNLPSPQKNI